MRLSAKTVNILWFLTVRWPGCHTIWLNRQNMPGGLDPDDWNGPPRLLRGRRSTIEVCEQLFGHQVVEEWNTVTARDRAATLQNPYAGILSAWAKPYHYSENGLQTCTFICVSLLPRGPARGRITETAFGVRIAPLEYYQSMGIYSIACPIKMHLRYAASFHWLWERNDIKLGPMVNDYTSDIGISDDSLPLQAWCVQSAATISETIWTKVESCLDSFLILPLPNHGNDVTYWQPPAFKVFFDQSQPLNRDNHAEPQLQALLDVAWIVVSDVTTETVVAHNERQDSMQIEYEVGHQYRVCTYVKRSTKRSSSDARLRLSIVQLDSFRPR